MAKSQLLVLRYCRSANNDPGPANRNTSMYVMCLLDLSSRRLDFVVDRVLPRIQYQACQSSEIPKFESLIESWDRLD